MPRTPCTEAVLLPQVERPGDVTAWLLLRHEQQLVNAYRFATPHDALHALKHWPLDTIEAATDEFLSALTDDPRTFPALTGGKRSAASDYLDSLPWVPAPILLPTQNGQTT